MAVYLPGLKIQTKKHMVAINLNMGNIRKGTTHDLYAVSAWIYVLHRASKQEGYRVDEAKEKLRDFAKFYVNSLMNTDYEKNEHWNDMHMLFGGLCGLAELQLALPGEIISDFPLKLVLDRRPFI